MACTGTARVLLASRKWLLPSPGESGRGRALPRDRVTCVKALSCIRTSSGRPEGKGAGWPKPAIDL